MAGLSAACWGEASAVSIAPQGLRARVPGALEPMWHVEPMARVVATATWRPLDWFSVEMGPYATWLARNVAGEAPKTCQFQHKRTQAHREQWSRPPRGR
jgi:hypothetical protein